MRWVDDKQICRISFNCPECQHTWYISTTIEPNYQVIVDGTNNTPDIIARNELRATIILKPRANTTITIPPYGDLCPKCGRQADPETIY